MKNRYMAVMMGLMLTAASVCGGTVSVVASEEAVAKEEGLESGEEQQEDVIYGEITEISDGKLTIAVGTRKEMGEPGEAPEKPEGGGEAPEKPEGDGGVPEGGGEAPEKPEGDGEAPEMPEGSGEAPEMPEGGGEAPEMPEGSGEVPQMPGEGGQPSMLELTGETMELTITDSTVLSRQGMEGEEGDPITLEELQAGDTVSVVADEDGNVLSVTLLSMQMGGGMGGPGGPSGGVESYEAVNEYTEDTQVDGGAFQSTGADENAVHIMDGANVTLNNVTVSRESQDSTGGDESSFYGVGAAVLATDGTAYLQGGSVTTDSKGGAGIFAYGDGTVYAADTIIDTSQDTSGGIHAAGGGSLYAWNLNVETDGESSAAIRSDRGGGTMVVDGGSYTSNGLGSPAVYCTADISVNQSALTATGSEAVCIEGLNSLRLYDCDLSGDMKDQEQNDCTWNVILYQSMSGDSEVGNSTFQMDGGTLTAKNGGMFYTTNTECTITLSDVDITYAEDNDFFLQCTGNNNQRGWGKAGANGSDCLFTAISQEMQGDIIWDSISDLDFYVTEGSTLTGAVLDNEEYAGQGGDGFCRIYLDADSTWTVTGDSVVTSLSSAGTIVDESGRTVTVLGTDGTVYVEGDSDYTITVESYDSNPDLSGASAMTEWSQYETEKPSELNA